MAAMRVRPARSACCNSLLHRRRLRAGAPHPSLNVDDDGAVGWLWVQVFARVIWPRIGAPTQLQDARPHRFGQFVGFLFTALALISFALGVDVAGLALTAVTFGVAALNASPEPAWAARPTC